MKRNVKNAVRGFTLIELLVVVAIIVVLIAILIPSLSKARDNAKAAVCQSNLRQLGAALLMYANDYDQWLSCATASGGTPGYWKVEMSLYMRNQTVDWNTMITDARYGARGPFACPAFAGVSSPCMSKLIYNPGLFGGLAWSNSISYRGDTQRARLRSFTNPYESAIIGDTTDVSQYYVPNGSYAYDYMYLYPRGAYPVDNRISRRHNGGLNILWADMHVEWKTQNFMATGRGGNTGYYYAIH